ncbi:MAG: nitrogen fixation protein FixH [Lysobacteraceae bacterium]|nr:MAG: nitrogen fixation protein FixH [Xanthomonadaceae bacterium]
MTDRDDVVAPKASPWRNPMVWLMVGFPLAAVVAGIATVIIAVNAGGNDASPDEVRRTAQIQTTELGPDARAGALKLSAVMSVHEETVEVLPATGEFDRTQPLRLLLQHPSRAAEDRELRLLPNDRGWQARFTLDTSHDWRIQLVPEGRAWRLRARLPVNQRGVLLAPAFGESGVDESEADESEQGVPAPGKTMPASGG